MLKGTQATAFLFKDSVLLFCSSSNILPGSVSCRFKRTNITIRTNLRGGRGPGGITWYHVTTKSDKQPQGDGVFGTRWVSGRSGSPNLDSV